MGDWELLAEATERNTALMRWQIAFDRFANWTKL